MASDAAAGKDADEVVDQLLEQYHKDEEESELLVDPADLLMKTLSNVPDKKAKKRSARKK